MTNPNVESRLTESESNNLSLVKRLFNEVWNDRHLDIIAEIFSADVVLQYDQGKLQGIKNWQEKFYTPLIEALPDLHITIEDIAADKDLVITRWKACGTFNGMLFGVHPTREMKEFNGMSWMQIFEGKIVAMWTNWDVSYLISQLLKEIKDLRSIIPICMHCKGIRNDKGYWEKIENYISEYFDVEFSHSICDKCLKELYPEE